MKKLTALLLSAALFAGTVCMATGPTLTTEQAQELAQFQIMTGDSDGDLRLTDPITRAEAVKMVCTAADIPENSNSTFNFPDIPASHWAYGYICAAKGAGIIHGDENGNFNPDAPITNDQMVKMIVCALGYMDYAQFLGGYPLGFNAIAEQQEIVAGLQLTGTNNTTRNDAGIMLYNALQTPIVQQQGFDNGVPVFRILDGTNGTDLVTLKDRLLENK